LQFDSRFACRDSVSDCAGLLALLERRHVIEERQGTGTVQNLAAVRLPVLRRRDGFFLHAPPRSANLRGLMSSKHFKIAALAGDGIGPEVMREALKVLRVAEKKFGFTLQMAEAPVGWAGIDAAGKALPDDTLALCKKSDAILFGSVGLPDRDPTISKEQRPERAALLRLRKEFALFANLRPVKLLKELADI
jgi:hypothetical protein